MNKNELFIKKAIDLHGNKYDYSKFEYRKSRLKSIIICKEHGEFEQSPSSHLRSYGCIKCSDNKCGRLDTEMFIKKATEIYGNKYNYSNVFYKNIDTKVEIICSKHGIFYQTPFCHFKYECKKCGREKGANKCKSNTKEFIEKAIKLHGNKYDYNKVNYVSAIEKVTIICKEHGDFQQSPREHLSKKGCLLCGFSICSDIRRGDTKDFIEKSKLIHNEKYDYCKVDYLNNHSPVAIICRTHGEFKQTPKKHIKNSGCPLCVNKTEGIFYNKLKQIYPSITTQFRKAWCKSKRYLPFDFCIPEHNIIIELDGGQHFKQVRNWPSPEKQFETDKYKEKCANENQYSIIRILQEDVFNNRYDWTKEICDSIEEIKQNKTITNKYICKNGEYDKYQI